MIYRKYLKEAKNMPTPMIGFGFDNSDIQETSNYVMRQLIEENIRYKYPDEYHLSVVLLKGRIRKDVLVRELDTMITNFRLTPVGLKILKGKVIKRDFVVIAYKPNDVFVNEVKRLQSKYPSVIFDKIIPHLSLFTVKRNVISDKLLKSISDNTPFKRIKPKEVQIWNAKHAIEYTKNI